MQTPFKTEFCRSVPPHKGAALLWNALLSALVLWWVDQTLTAPWGSLAPRTLWCVLAATAAWVLCAAAAETRRAWLAWLLRLLPWTLLAWTAQAVQGLMLWVNCVLTQWNQLHRDGLALFQAEATAQSVLAISLLTAVAAGELTWWLVTRRRTALCALLGGALLLLALLTGTMRPLACGCWLSALMGLRMSRGTAMPPRQVLRLWSVCTAVLCLCALFGSGAELDDITRLRNETARTIHELRYGQDLLPQGRLADAARLHESTDERLIVRTGEEKNLYLRAFVGADYKEGVWLPLSGASYSGAYAGMLDWLAEQDFDPLTQPAAYYALSESGSTPDENLLRIQVTGGARCYLYAPSTAASVTMTSYTDEKDQRMKPDGFMGAELYAETERSPVRPAELTVRADWVAAPQTDAQRQYAQAEAVYRTFVYDSYTQADERLAPLLDELFWQDYVPESDGVYRAVDRVRSVLRQQTTYGEPEEQTDGTEPIRAFLTGASKGNAVLYASAAVEALRCHGVPARYVEGYYLSAVAVAESADGTVALTGQDAHAWVEIYFDGVGWLPVDVTPGYYYDAVSLREMIALPDTVRKTAALDDSFGGNDVSMVPETAERPQKPQPAEMLRNAGMVLLGCVAMLVLLLTLRFLLLRVTRTVVNSARKHRYLRADAPERARLLEEWIYAALAAQGLDACLGWNAAETDAEIAQRFSQVEPGEYSRAVALMEKFTYGAIAPEPFELRVLQAFLTKVYVADWRLQVFARRVLDRMGRRRSASA